MSGNKLREGKQPVSVRLTHLLIAIAGIGKYDGGAGNYRPRRIGDLTADDAG